MERSSKGQLKQQSNIVVGRNMKMMMNKSKVKDQCLWDDDNDEAGDHEIPGVFSWPPRSYTCSFCKREFRSAQALGGHMNVHRRDRAKLRQSPPRDHHGQFSLQNPNPSFSSPSPSPIISSTSTNKFPLSNNIPTFPPLFPSHLSTLSSVPPAEVTKTNKQGKDGLNLHPGSLAADFTKINKSTKGFFGLEKKLGCNSIMHEKGGAILKKGEIVRLELEIGLLGEAKEELDLELRLGYS